jgi:hypothetical protein
MLDSVTQVYSDSWCPEWCAYTYFAPHAHATLLVTLGRTGYGGSAPPARTTVTIGTVTLDHNGNPQLGLVERRLRRTVANGAQETLRVPLTRTPVRVEVTVPEEDLIPPGTDPRNLGVQVAFRVEAPGT